LSADLHRRRRPTGQPGRRRRRVATTPVGWRAWHVQGPGAVVRSSAPTSIAKADGCDCREAWLTTEPLGAGTPGVTSTTDPCRSPRASIRHRGQPARPAPTPRPCPDPCRDEPEAVGDASSDTRRRGDARQLTIVDGVPSTHQAAALGQCARGRQVTTATVVDSGELVGERSDEAPSRTSPTVATVSRAVSSGRRSRVRAPAAPRCDGLPTWSHRSRLRTGPELKRTGRPRARHVVTSAEPRRQDSGSKHHEAERDPADEPRHDGQHAPSPRLRRPQHRPHGWRR
jgi:hypothetical protein